MNEKFDWDKWHRKALEDSKAENQLLKLIPRSSFEEIRNYMIADLRICNEILEDVCDILRRELLSLYQQVLTDGEQKQEEEQK